MQSLEIPPHKCATAYRATDDARGTSTAVSPNSAASERASPSRSAHPSSAVHPSLSRAPAPLATSKLKTLPPPTLSATFVARPIPCRMPRALGHAQYGTLRQDRRSVTRTERREKATPPLAQLSQPRAIDAQQGVRLQSPRRSAPQKKREKNRMRNMGERGCATCGKSGSE